MSENKDLMQTIAEGNINDYSQELNQLDTTKEQIKLFLLAEARNNLIRIVKMTNFLNSVEDKFQEKVTKSMENDAIPMEYYSEIISTIMISLQRSSEIVSKVLKDDTLTNLILIDNSTAINSNNGSNSVSSILASTDSRDRVSKAVQKVLSMIDTNIEESGGQIENE